jgi:GNAT superfamily N-acetyltransferase
MSGEPPPLTSEALVRRLDAVSERFMAAWLEGAAGVALTRLGDVVLPSNPDDPELDFQNRVIGLRAEHRELVPRIVEHYAERGLRPWFELSPEPDFAALVEALTAAGATQIGVDALHVGRPARLHVETPGVEVRPVGEEEIETFGRTLLRGDELPEEIIPAAIDDLRHWPRLGWRLYLALVEGEPAGAAALVLDDGVGYLASAATLPEMRRRGCQTALIAARLAAAQEAGCELVSSQTRFFSQSQRNLERAGLRLAYAKAVWRVAPSAAGRVLGTPS